MSAIYWVFELNLESVLYSIRLGSPFLSFFLFLVGTLTRVVHIKLIMIRCGIRNMPQLETLSIWYLNIAWPQVLEKKLGVHAGVAGPPSQLQKRRLVSRHCDWYTLEFE